AATTCGNGVVEAFEDCDTGGSNGPPPAGCSTVCRTNPGATPPTWPTSSSLTLAATSPTSVQLTWTAATDPNGVTAYKIYQGSTYIATVSGTTLSYTASGLTAGTADSFSVQAVNATGAPTTTGPSTLICTPVDICHQAGTYKASTATCTTGASVVIDDG